MIKIMAIKLTATIIIYKQHTSNNLDRQNKFRYSEIIIRETC